MESQAVPFLYFKLRTPEEVQSPIFDVFYAENDKHLGELYQEVDGYYVFAPDGQGGWDSRGMRTIANKLDELNEPYDAEVNAYFEQLANTK